MGRFYTQHVQSNTPARAKSRRSPLKSGLRYVQRSPLASKSNNTAAARARHPVPSLGRFSRVKKSHDAATFDKPRNEESVFRAYREFARQDDDDGEQEDRSTDSGEDDLDWDEEATLVAILEEESPASSDSDLIALAEALKAPMSAQGALLKQDLVQTLVPATRRVKEAHRFVDEKINVNYGKGLLAFNDAAKQVEGMCIQDEEDLKKTYVEHQTRIKEMFTQLKAAYARRDRIFSDFQKLMDESAERVCADLQSLPANVNHTIDALEQKSKDLFKDTGNGAKSKEKMLKGLLEKL